MIYIYTNGNYMGIMWGFLGLLNDFSMRFPLQWGIRKVVDFHVKSDLETDDEQG